MTHDEVISTGGDMTPLSEVAADVAQALKTKGHWSHEAHPRFLMEDGSNLNSPYWRCRCEDWLIEHGWRFVHQDHHLQYPTDPSLAVTCPWPETPARLVSAVYRKMQEGKQS